MNTSMKFRLSRVKLTTRARWVFMSPTSCVVIGESSITLIVEGRTVRLVLNAPQFTMLRRNRRLTKNEFTSELNMTTLVMVVI